MKILYWELICKGFVGQYYILVERKIWKNFEVIPIPIPPDQS